MQELAKIRKNAKLTFQLISLQSVANVFAALNSTVPLCAVSEKRYAVVPPVWCKIALGTWDIPNVLNFLRF